MIRYILALCLAAAPVAGQVLTPGRRIAATELGHAQLDSMAHRAMVTRQEQMSCVTALVLDGDTLVIARIAPAKNVVRADSVGMDFNGPPAEWWQPCVHTHFLDVPLRDYASPPDNHSVALRNLYGLLMIVKPDTTWTLKPYP